MSGSLDTTGAAPAGRRRTVLTAVLVSGALLAAAAVGLGGAQDPTTVAAAEPASSPAPDSAAGVRTRVVPASPSPVSPPPASVPAPANEQPGSLADSAVEAGEGGRDRNAQGVPVGFQRSQDGAVAAATVALMLWQSSGMWLPEVRQDVLPGLLSPQLQAGSAGDIDVAFAEEAQTLGLTRDGQAPAGATVLSDLRPTWGAYRVDQYAPDAATVTIWAPLTEGLSRPGTPPPTATWQRATLRMVWAVRPGDSRPADWQLDAVPSFTDGPTPPGPAGSPPSLFDREDALNAGWVLYANTEV